MRAGVLSGFQQNCLRCLAWLFSFLFPTCMQTVSVIYMLRIPLYDVDAPPSSVENTSSVEQRRYFAAIVAATLLGKKTKA